jgi:formate dehydrogenase major subunit
MTETPRVASELLRLEIDGREIWTPWDRTVLEVALGAGIEIPRLCHSLQLRPTATAASAWWRSRRAGPVRACSPRPWRGMVRTSNPRSRRAHAPLRGAFSDHWADCIAPCRLACPRTPTPRFITLIARGGTRRGGADQADQPLRASSAGSAQPCESACRRALVDDPIGICFTQARGRGPRPPLPDRYRPEVGPATGSAWRSSARAGRPAAAASLDGHAPVVFEALPSRGDARYGIPAYASQGHPRRRDRPDPRARGGLHTNRRLGRTSPSVPAGGYDAVFLGSGAKRQRARPPGSPGS